MQYLMPPISDCFEENYAILAGSRWRVPVSPLPRRLSRVADEWRAIEKLDAVIQSTRLGRPSLDSIPKMALEAGPGLAPASPSNNVVGWPKIFPPSKRNPLQMKPFSFRLSLSTPFIAAVLALLSLSVITSPAEAQASHRIEAYYNQLMPTLRAAGQLSVRERDRRFSPAITSAFDIGTMARLASGPAWSKFSGAQQAAVRDAFARFLVAEYAHQVGDYSGESFVVDPQTSPSQGGGEVVKTRLLQPGGRTVQINYLVRGGRIIDVYLNGTISDLATRRDEFASILAGGGGADALVKTLRERTESLLAG
jgi:phospholipid transport system substrate-binding protein